MIKRIKNRVYCEIENIKFKVFSNILKKYNVEIFHKDRMGFVIKRKYNDNFKYIFETNNSCDAVPLMESLNKKINNSKVGIDVGANIGITTIWMSRNCQKVYAFEPEIENIKRFNENLLANNIVNVELIEKAVSDSQGKMELNILESYGHHSLGKVLTSKQIGIQLVSVVTLDMFCAARNIDEIDFLKVDVEGFEIEVFRGAVNLFKNKKINLVAFEISEVPLKSLDKSEQEIFDFLESVDYEMFYLNGRKFNTDNFTVISHLDLIASPKEFIDE